MKEGPSNREAPVSTLEARRESLMRKIVEIRPKLMQAMVDPNEAKRELEFADEMLQSVQNSEGMALFEEFFNKLEKLVDSKQ